MKQRLTTLAIAAMSLQAMAQKIDLNMSGRQEQEVNEVGFQPWVTGRTISSTQDFITDNGETITITLAADKEDQWLGSIWWKDACTKLNNKLLGDAAGVYLKDNDNIVNLTTQSAEATMTITGMPAGHHSLIVYMNTPEKAAGSLIAPVEISVNGTVVGSDFKQGARPTAISEGEFAYLSFEAEDGKDVVVHFKTIVGEQEWESSGLYINALLFDRPNPRTQAADPVPANRDFHVDADNGSVNLVWTMASSAVKNHVLVGTSSDDMKEVAVTSTASFLLNDVTNLETYYWRIDEEDAAGNVFNGETWTFRPRHLAFPGAEGYGRFATGGRGGSVYHVTTLEDNGDDANPIPGSFRYGIKAVKGPRTIVFDVSGTIYLKARLFCSDEYVTVAGQTAPSHGILFRGAPFGISSESQARFLRMRRGFHNDDESDYSRGLDGLGINGDHSIMDHCSISWTIDEAHSSRNAKNISFQNNFISEALNDAHHPNYAWGACHGYAATIGGETSSYHHNLLAHNEGRNWSISGGLSGAGYYAGAHDMFNNVCYNWGGRATDGGTHEGQFVNNYYIMGPATTQKYLLNAQIEGTGKGSQAYYVSGNIREEKNGSLTADELNETYRYSLSGGQVLDWEVFVAEPFFPSYATVDPAKLAYKKVISDSGVNYIGLDSHDARVLNDVIDRTFTYTGSSTGKKGLIDREWDAEGYDDSEFPETHRLSLADIDNDGMPNWWETITGTDMNTPDNNADLNGDGYTALEDYLNYMAGFHVETLPGIPTGCIDHFELTRGFSAVPTVVSAPSDFNVEIKPTDYTDSKGHIHRYWIAITPSSSCKPGVYQVVIEVDDNDGVGSMTRVMQVAVLNEGNDAVTLPTFRPSDTAEYFNLSGQKVGKDYKGVVVVKDGSRCYKTFKH